MNTNTTEAPSAEPKVPRLNLSSALATEGNKPTESPQRAGKVGNRKNLQLRRPISSEQVGSPVKNGPQESGSRRIPVRGSQTTTPKVVATPRFSPTTAAGSSNSSNTHRQPPGKTPRRPRYDPSIHTTRLPSGISSTGRRFCFIIVISVLFSALIATLGFRLMTLHKKSLDDNGSDDGGAMAHDGDVDLHNVVHIPTSGPFIEAMNSKKYLDSNCKQGMHQVVLYGPPEHPPSGSVSQEDTVRVPFVNSENTLDEWVPVDTIFAAMKSRCLLHGWQRRTKANPTTSEPLVAVAVSKVDAVGWFFAGSALSAELQRLSKVPPQQQQPPSTPPTAMELKMFVERELKKYLGMEKVPEAMAEALENDEAEASSSPHTIHPDHLPIGVVLVDPPAELVQLHEDRKKKEPTSSTEKNVDGTMITTLFKHFQQGTWGSVAWPAALAASLVDSFPARAFATALKSSIPSKKITFLTHQARLHHVPLFDPRLEAHTHLHIKPSSEGDHHQTQRRQHSSNWNQRADSHHSSSSGDAEKENIAIRSPLDYFLWSATAKGEKENSRPTAPITACQIVKRRSDMSTEVVSHGVSLQCGAGAGSSCTTYRTSSAGYFDHQNAMLVERRRGRWAKFAPAFADNHSDTLRETLPTTELPTPIVGFSPLCFIANTSSTLVKEMVKGIDFASHHKLQPAAQSEETINGEDDDGFTLSLEDDAIAQTATTSWQKLSRAVAFVEIGRDNHHQSNSREDREHLAKALATSKDFLKVVRQWLQGSLAHGCGGHTLRPHIPLSAVQVSAIELEAMKGEHEEHHELLNNQRQDGDEEPAGQAQEEEQSGQQAPVMTMIDATDLSDLLRDASVAFNAILRSPCVTRSQQHFMAPIIEQLLFGKKEGKADEKNEDVDSNDVLEIDTPLIDVSTYPTAVIGNSIINDAPLGAYYPAKARSSSFFTSTSVFPSNPLSTAPQVGQLRLADVIGPLDDIPSVQKRLEHLFAKVKHDAAMVGEDEAIGHVEKVMNSLDDGSNEDKSNRPPKLQRSGGAQDTALDVTELKSMQGRHHGKVHHMLKALRVTWAGFCCSCCGFSNEIASMVVPLSEVIDVKSTLGVDCHCPGLADASQSVILRQTVNRDAAVVESCKQHQQAHELPPEQQHRHDDEVQRATGSCKDKIDELVLSSAQTLTATLDRHGYTVDPNLLVAPSTNANKKKKQPQGGRRSIAPINVRIVHTDPISAARYVWRESLPEYLIYRSMTESTEIPDSWVSILNEQVDEVWVPSGFVKDTFVASGVFAKKVVVVPEPVNTEAFSPFAPLAPVKFPLIANSKHGHPESKWRSAELMGSACSPRSDLSKTHFNFFSNFKWESRKGWIELFAAYFRQFTCKDDVVLTIATYFFSADDLAKKKKRNQGQDEKSTNSGGANQDDDSHPSDFFNEEEFGLDSRDPEILLKMIKSYVTDILVEDGARMLPGTSREGKLFDPSLMPRVVIITESLREESLTRLYKTADAFVLPTRGEGWGLPIAQAMSMALPTIVTRHGGHMDFVSEDVVELVDTELRAYSKDNAKKKWGVADVASLSSKMRKVFEHRKAAEDMGKRARQHIQEHFCSDCVRSKVLARLAKVGQIVEQRRTDQVSYYVRRLMRSNEKRGE